MSRSIYLVVGTDDCPADSRCGRVRAFTNRADAEKYKTKRQREEMYWRETPGHAPGLGWVSYQVVEAELMGRDEARDICKGGVCDYSEVEWGVMCFGAMDKAYKLWKEMMGYEEG